MDWCDRQNSTLFVPIQSLSRSSLKRTRRFLKARSRVFLTKLWNIYKRYVRSAAFLFADLTRLILLVYTLRSCWRLNSRSMRSSGSPMSIPRPDAPSTTVQAPTNHTGTDPRLINLRCVGCYYWPLAQPQQWLIHSCCCVTIAGRWNYSSGIRACCTEIPPWAAPAQLGLSLIF